MDNYVKKNYFKNGTPPYLYSGYQDSPVLVLVTWDQIGNRTNLLETFCDKKKFL